MWSSVVSSLTPHLISTNWNSTAYLSLKEDKEDTVVMCSCGRLWSRPSPPISCPQTGTPRHICNLKRIQWSWVHVVACGLISHPHLMSMNWNSTGYLSLKQDNSGHVFMWSSVVSSLNPHLMSTNWNSTAYLSLKEDTKVVTYSCGRLWSHLSSPPHVYELKFYWVSVPKTGQQWSCVHVVVCGLVSYPPPHVNKLELHCVFVPERGYSGHVFMWSSVVSSLTPHLMSTNWNSTAYLSLKEDTVVISWVHVVVCSLVSHPPPHVHKLELHGIFVPERRYSGHIMSSCCRL